MTRQNFFSAKNHMEDGFQVVKSKKRKCKPRQVFGVPNTHLEDVESVYKKLLKITGDFKTSSFCTDLVEKIRTSLLDLKRNKIDEVLSYGLGKFSQNISSLHQLAALIIISEIFDSSVKIFDPLFDSTEKTILQRINFGIIAENEEGKRKIIPKYTSLVYLPHCPKQLTNNFLWANWNLSIFNCIVISNSFSKIVESNTEKDLLESASYIWKIQKLTEEVALENSYDLSNVFNDLSIHYFTDKKIKSSFFEGEFKEPKYTTDTEFITKELQKTRIENV